MNSAIVDAVLALPAELVAMFVLSLDLRDIAAWDACGAHTRVPDATWRAAIARELPKHVWSFLGVDVKADPRADITQVWRGARLPVPRRANVAIALLDALLRDDLKDFLAALRAHWWIWDTTDLGGRDSGTHFHYNNGLYGLCFDDELDLTNELEARCGWERANVARQLTHAALYEMDPLYRHVYVGWNSDPVTPVPLRRLVELAVTTEAAKYERPPRAVCAHARKHNVL